MLLYKVEFKIQPPFFASLAGGKTLAKKPIKEVLERIYAWEAKKILEYMEDEEYPDLASARVEASVRRRMHGASAKEVRRLANQIKISVAQLRQFYDWIMRPID